MGKDLFTKLIEAENARDAYRRKWMDEVELGKVLEKENATIKAQNAELQELGDTMSEGFDKVTDECMGLRAQVPRWRSVEDELPEEGVHVLAHELGDTFLAWYGDDGDGLWYLPDGDYGFTLSHWMPLPTPPEGGQP